MRILFAENHPVLAGTVTDTFLAAHQVTVVPSIAAAERALLGPAFDAVLVDYDLDDGKGDASWRGSRVRSNRRGSTPTSTASCDRSPEA